MCVMCTPKGDPLSRRGYVAACTCTTMVLHSYFIWVMSWSTKGGQQGNKLLSPGPKGIMRGVSLRGSSVLVSWSSGIPYLRDLWVHCMSDIRDLSTYFAPEMSHRGQFMMRALLHLTSWCHHRHPLQPQYGICTCCILPPRQQRTPSCCD